MGKLLCVWTSDREQPTRAHQTQDRPIRKPSGVSPEAPIGRPSCILVPAKQLPARHEWYPSCREIPRRTP